MKTNDNKAYEFSQKAIKKIRKAPIGFYGIKDRLINISSNPNFFDTVLLCFAFLIDALVFGFYPIILVGILLVILGVFTLKHAFLGLIVFLALIFPTVMYQAPGLAWILLIGVSITFIFGYQHYRTITFIFILTLLAFTNIGRFLEVPVFIIAILMIGYKRGIILTISFIILVVALSGTMNLVNTGYIISNPHLNELSSYSALTQPYKPNPTIFTFKESISTTINNFINPHATFSMAYVFGILIKSLMQKYFYLIQIILMIVIVIIIDNVAFNDRTKLRGMKAGIVGVGYPLIFIGLSIMNKSFKIDDLFIFISFSIAPLLLYLFAIYDIDIVQVLDVRKKDLRLKFGEAFEELEVGKTNETLDDIANYEGVKKELKEAISNPIEERAISRAYNVEPSRGIMFFGPPGTGKTLMMRAFSNEIRAGFYYISAGNLISSYPGETEKKIIEIFRIARKHAPCILFFDEIDSIGTSRQMDIDEIHRHALTQLLIELDGFQRINNVVIVGATNIPEVLDPALLRPGRFDKLIYMPLPELSGRKLIFKMYLNKLPISDDINFDDLARRTERFSGADIRNVCESVAQMIAQKASTKHEILAITKQDIEKILTAIKPSTSLLDIEKYNKFKLMFERTIYGSVKEDTKEAINVIGLDAVKKAVDEAIEIPLKYPEMIKKYGIKPVNGIMLFGPPGNGKTMMLRKVSKGIKGVTMIELDTADILKMGADEALNKIKEQFNIARENAPSVIFIDEIDALFPKREISSPQEYIQLTGEMLNQIDGIEQFSNVVIMAATNRPNAIDSALLRPGRFDKLIFVRPPEQENRVLLFKQNLINIRLDDNVDFEKIGKETRGFTGADIVNVCRRIKINAIKQNIENNDEINITMENIEQIVKKTKPSAPEIIVSQYLSFLSKYGER